jgi:hypothetical protein
MKVIHRILLCAAVLLSSQLAGGQTFVGVYGGQTISTFRFVDEDGGADMQQRSVTGGTYHLGLEHHMPSQLYLSAAFGYKKAGSATTVDQTVVTYRLDYADLQFKGGITFFQQGIYNKSIWSPFVELGLYAGMAWKMEQMIGDAFYDLMKEGALKKTDAGALGGAGLLFTAGNHLRIKVGAFYQRGLLSIEESSDQKTFNKIISIEGGLFLKLQ